MIISQREAMRLKKRVKALEEMIRNQRRNWSREYPGGTHLGNIPRVRDWFSGRVEAAGMLGHAVVVSEDGDGVLKFYALPLPSEKL